VADARPADHSLGAAGALAPVALPLPLPAAEQAGDARAAAQALDELVHRQRVAGGAGGVAPEAPRLQVDLFERLLPQRLAQRNDAVHLVLRRLRSEDAPHRHASGAREAREQVVGGGGGAGSGGSRTGRAGGGRLAVDHGSTRPPPPPPPNPPAGRRPPPRR